MHIRYVFLISIVFFCLSTCVVGPFLVPIIAAIEVAVEAILVAVEAAVEAALAAAEAAATATAEAASDMMANPAAFISRQCIQKVGEKAFKKAEHKSKKVKDMIAQKVKQVKDEKEKKMAEAAAKHCAEEAQKKDPPPPAKPAPAPATSSAPPKHNKRLPRRKKKEKEKAPPPPPPPPSQPPCKPKRAELSHHERFIMERDRIVLEVLDRIAEEFAAESDTMILTIDAPVVQKRHGKGMTEAQLDEKYFDNAKKCYEDMETEKGTTKHPGPGASLHYTPLIGHKDKIIYWAISEECLSFVRAFQKDAQSMKGHHDDWGHVTELDTAKALKDYAKDIAADLAERKPKAEQTKDPEAKAFKLKYLELNIPKEFAGRKSVLIENDDPIFKAAFASEGDADTGSFNAGGASQPAPPKADAAKKPDDKKDEKKKGGKRQSIRALPAYLSRVELGVGAFD